MIKVHFYSSLKPGALLIRAFTKSRYSHVSISVGGFVYEAKMFTGVTCKTKAPKPAKTLILHGLNEDHIKAFLKQQVGKKYDFTALANFISRRDWQETSSWFCSELVAMALKVGGLDKFEKEVYKISPGYLYNKIVT